MENTKKVIIKTEGLEYTCPDCGKKFISTSESQQAFNIGIHKSICEKKGTKK